MPNVVDLKQQNNHTGPEEELCVLRSATFGSIITVQFFTKEDSVLFMR